MIYALVRNGTIEQVGALPRLWVDADDHWWDFRNPLPAGVTLAGLGWLEVVQVARPADTATTTFDYSITLQAGVPTVTWTERPKTQAELDADAAEAVQSSIDAKMDQALTANNDYLALSNPSTAQSIQQIRILTREANGLIRLARGDFSTDDA